MVLKSEPTKSLRASFAQLRSFEAVARLGGVTRAATALHLTQPTVSTQLRELRAALGVDVLQPDGRGVKLTDAGRDLLATVNSMFAQWSAFEDGLDDAQGLVKGQLRIAGVTTTEYFLAQWLKPFLAAYPGVDVELRIDNRDAVVRLLEASTADLGVMMVPPTHLPLTSRTVMANPLVLIGPLDHPWAQLKTLGKTPGKTPSKTPLKRLSGIDLLMREVGSGTRQATLDFLAQHRIAPKVRMSLGSNEAIKHAVAAGLGLAIISEHALNPRPKSEGLCVLQVTGLPIQRSWQLVWRKDRRLPRAASVFAEFIAAQNLANPLG